MCIFLEKAEKSPQRWGLRPQTPVSFRRLGAGGSAPRPPSCYFNSINLLIFSTAQHFFTPLKLRPIISYLSDSSWAPLLSLLPFPWLKPLVTPLILLDFLK